MTDNHDAIKKLISSDRFTILYIRSFDVSSHASDETKSTYLSYNTRKVRKGMHGYLIDFEEGKDPAPWMIKFKFEEKGPLVLPSVDSLTVAPPLIEELSDHLTLRVGFEDVLDAINNDVSLIGMKSFYADIVAKQYHNILKGFKYKED